MSQYYDEATKQWVRDQADLDAIRNLLTPEQRAALLAWHDAQSDANECDASKEGVWCCIAETLEQLQAMERAP